MIVRALAGFLGVILLAGLAILVLSNSGKVDLYDQSIVPTYGSTVNLEVPEGEFAVMTGGDMYILGRFFEGGLDRGNVAIFAPGSYRIHELTAGHNWLGRYKGSAPNPFNVSFLKLPSDVRTRVDGMFRDPNCPSVHGCRTIQVAYVAHNGVALIYSENSFLNIPLPVFANLLS